MTLASPVWDIIGNDGAGGDNGLFSEGLHPGDGGASVAVVVVIVFGLVLIVIRRRRGSTISGKLQPCMLVSSFLFSFFSHRFNFYVYNSIC
jgi:hypothetical protein